MSCVIHGFGQGKRLTISGAEDTEAQQVSRFVTCVDSVDQTI